MPYMLFERKWLFFFFLHEGFGWGWDSINYLKVCNLKKKQYSKIFIMELWWRWGKKKRDHLLMRGHVMEIGDAFVLDKYALEVVERWSTSGVF